MMSSPDFPSWVTILGFTAAFCTTVSFVPQVVKSVRTKQTSDISLPMYIVFGSGIALWLAYAFFTHDLPLLAANTVTFVLVAAVLGLKIKHG